LSEPVRMNCISALFHAGYRWAHIPAPTDPVAPAVLMLANFKHKSSGLPLHHRRGRVVQMGQQRTSYVVGLADVNPLARIGDPIDTDEVGAWAWTITGVNACGMSWLNGIWVHY